MLSTRYPTGVTSKVSSAVASWDFKDKSSLTPSMRSAVRGKTISAYRQRQDHKKIRDMLSKIDVILADPGSPTQMRQPFLELLQQLSELGQLQEKMRNKTQLERSFVLPHNIQQLDRKLSKLSQDHYKKLASDLILRPISQSFKKITDYYGTKALTRLAKKASEEINTSVSTKEQASDVIHKYRSELKSIEQGNVDKQIIDKQRDQSDKKKPQQAVKLRQARQRWLNTLLEIENLVDQANQLWPLSKFVGISHKSDWDGYRDYINKMREWDVANPNIAEVDQILGKTLKQLKGSIKMYDRSETLARITVIILLLSLAVAGFIVMDNAPRQAGNGRQAVQLQNSIHNTHPDIKKLYEEAERKNIIYKADYINKTDLDNIPHEYVCPITRELLIVPLKIKINDGELPQCYEAKDLIDWFKIRRIVPMTNEPIGNTAASVADVIHVDDALRKQLWKYINNTYSKLYKKEKKKGEAILEVNS